jgi:hypothetical protein
MRIKTYLILFFVANFGVAQAQNTTSPYSIYGIGIIQTSAYNRTTGMGSTGIAYRSENNIVQNNPAAYTALIPQMFHIEAGGRSDFSSYNNASFSNTGYTNQVSNDFSVTRIAFATKVNKWWGSSMGLLPYSSMNYDFTGLQPLGPQGEEASVTYQGSGGIHKAYWGNGFSLGKHFSVGATASFLFGALHQSETEIAPTANANLVATRNLYLRNMNFDFGAQYYTHFGRSKQWGLTLGATYAPKQALYAEDSLSVTQNGAVLPNGNALLDRNYFNLPSGYGGGFSISKESTMKRVTFLADYARQLWQPLNYSGTGYYLGNSDRYSAGFEVSRKSNIFNTPVEHVYYQLGGFYNKSYINVDGYPLLEWGASIGLGINPLRYPQWGYHLALEYGATSNYEQGAVKENFVRLTVTIHYWDRWFTRGRKVL